MSGKPAARVRDRIACPVPQTTPAAAPHAPPPGSPIAPPGATTVAIGGDSAARMGDESMCITPSPAPNMISSGAFPVLIEGMPAARLTDPGTHPGSTITSPGCSTVLIGLAGTTGNPRAGTEECLKAKESRNPPPGHGYPDGSPMPPGTQSYNNCGVESARQILNRKHGVNVGQEQLLDYAKKKGFADVPAIGSKQGSWVVTPQNQGFFSGRMDTNQMTGLLSKNGVGASQVAKNKFAPSLSDIKLPITRGQGVIAAVGTKGLPGGGNVMDMHAVLVTGVVYDDNGKVKKVIYNDTGTGACGEEVSGDDFQNALDQQSAMRITQGQTPHPFVVTNNPVW